MGTVVASLTSLTLLPTYGVRPVYALGAVALLLLPVAWKVLPESPAYLRAVGRDDEAAVISARYGLAIPAAPRRFGSATRGAAVRLFRDGHARSTVCIWLVTLVSLLTIFGLTTWLPQLMREAGYGTSAAISFLLFYSLGAIVGTLVASQIGQRTSPKVMVVAGFCCAVVALAVIWTRPDGALLVAAVVLAGVGGLGTQNMIAGHTAQYYPAHLRATGLGWSLAVGRLGAIAGPTYGAFLIGTNGGVRDAALAFGIPAAVGAVIALAMPSFVGRRTRPTPDSAAAPVATEPAA